MATPTSPLTGAWGAARFVFLVTISHLVTYFVAGLVASRVFDYSAIFQEPVIRDYYLPYASPSVAVAWGLQVVRGALFGLVLLPFRRLLAESRWGWLWLWLLVVVIGILGTPAAAPGSLEGVIYTQIPLWFHAIGMPEMLLQTLAFSFLVHRTLRSAEHPLPAWARTLLSAVSVASISFLGYTAVSLAFAFSAGVSLQAGSDLSVLGQFIAPLVLTIAAVLVTVERWWLPKYVALYVASAGALALYQWLVLGSAGWAYVLLAPILPVLISAAMTRPRKPPAPRPTPAVPGTSDLEP